MSQFEPIWRGEGEPYLRVLRDEATTREEAKQPPVPREVTEHFDAYCQERLAVVTEATTLLEVNQQKLRIIDVMMEDIALTTTSTERAIIFDTLYQALRTIRERQRDIEPPPFSHPVTQVVERPVVHRVPAAGIWLDESD